MTDKKSRRVVIINNINSDTIDQAIFILKSDERTKRTSYILDPSIADEAQDIIDSYIRQVDRIKDGYTPNPSSKKSKQKKSRAILLGFLCLSAVCIALSIALFQVIC